MAPVESQSSSSVEPQTASPEKVGKCPPPSGKFGICAITENNCSDDYACKGEMKCCAEGCGRECMMPEIA
jgi:hypothetical protein